MAGAELIGTAVTGGWTGAMTGFWSQDAKAASARMMATRFIQKKWQGVPVSAMGETGRPPYPLNSGI